MTLKQKLHERIETLSEAELEWLNAMLDRHSAEIPEEDEELDDEERADLRQALEALRNGEPTISAEEVQHQLGLPPLFPVK